MVNVTARKIRDHSTDSPAIGLGRVYTGYLVSYPIVGRGMVIFRDPHGHRMVTTPVKRVLGESEGNLIFVETENSVYKLEIRGDPLAVQEPSSEASSSLSR
jgi:hypothetical protein